VDPRRHGVAISSLSLLMKGERLTPGQPLARYPRRGREHRRRHPGVGCLMPVDTASIDTASSIDTAVGRIARPHIRSRSIEPVPPRQGGTHREQRTAGVRHHFRVDYEINPYMHTEVQPDPAAAVTEHEAIVAAHLAAGRKVEYLLFGHGVHRQRRRGPR
jgi:hypothetical protein